MAAVILDAIGFKALAFLSELALLLACLELVDGQVLPAPENHVSFCLIQLDVGDGMLDVEAGVVLQAGEGVRVVENDLVASFLQDGHQKKPRLGVPRSGAVPGLRPYLDEFHLNFLVELDRPLEGAHDLVAQRVESNHPRALVNDILVLLLYVVDIRVVDDA